MVCLFLFFFLILLVKRRRRIANGTKKIQKSHMCCLTHHMTHFHELKQRLTKADDRRNRGRKKNTPEYNATTARKCKHTQWKRTRLTQLGRQSTGLAWWKCKNSRDMASICTIFCVITLASHVCVCVDFERRLKRALNNHNSFDSTTKYSHGSLFLSDEIMCVHNSFFVVLSNSR